MSGPKWLPFALGTLLGLAGGLYYAWLISPVEYVETAPHSLRQDFREDYLALIGAAYASTGDLARARARLALFPELDPQTDLPTIAQQRFASGLSDADDLAELAADLARAQPRQATPTRSGPTATPTRSRPTATPTTTATPRPASPTPRPSATPVMPFSLAERQRVCDPVLPEPLIQVEVFDSAGEPVPGIELLIVWDDGQDHFFTGLKPELGLGYGDFSMSPEINYTLRLQDGGPPVTDLSTHTCQSEDEEDYLGSWYLRFEQEP